MHETYKTVIVDTSGLILLNQINEIVIFKKLFHTVTITEEIAKEFGKPLPEWILIKAVQNKELQRAIFIEVDLGEASAIALAREIQPALLVIDDLKGRRMAHRLQLKYTGTLGILLKAKREKIIPSLRPYFEKIKATNFRISKKLLDNILKEAGE